jgi:hypothetical protein
MKPHLLMLLLLAIPPLLANLVACENAENSDPTPASAAEKSCAAPAKETAVPAPTPANAPPVPPATSAPAKPAPTRNAASLVKAWDMM